MSTQKGNSTRTRTQKYKNQTSFKNNLHDTSHRTKAINSIQVCNVCDRCKEIIEWKIKYKKYKLLTQLKKCVKCNNRAIRKSYHTICEDCGKKLNVCEKCGQSKQKVLPVIKAEDSQLDKEMKLLVKALPERKRRTFNRFINNDIEKTKDEIMSKLMSLRVDDTDDDIFDEFTDSENE